MPAALGLHLVLEMHAGGTGADQVAGRARDRECGAEAGIRVHQQRQPGGAADAARVLADVVEARDAEVRQAERGVRDAGARQVERAETGTLREQRAVGIDGARDLQRPLGFDGVAKAPARGSLGHPAMIHGRPADPVYPRVDHAQSRHEPDRGRSRAVLPAGPRRRMPHAAVARMAARRMGRRRREIHVSRILGGAWTADLGGQGRRDFQGRSRRSTSAEELRLVEMADGVFYIAKVTHNELPVAFRLSECADGRFAFVNPTHDFPKRLDYVRQGEDRLVVRVSDGADKGFTLNFTRTQVPAASADAVLAAEDARFAAMVAADPEAMRRWFADDLAYVHSTGSVEDREQLIASILSGKLQIPRRRAFRSARRFSGPGGGDRAGDRAHQGPGREPVARVSGPLPGRLWPASTATGGCAPGNRCACPESGGRIEARRSCSGGARR